jgi:hypothetical protein
MIAGRQTPLVIGALISASLARIWHFKMELGVMWLGYLLSALLLLPFLPDLLRLQVALQHGATGQSVTIDSGSVTQIIVLTLLIIVFEAVLMVLWMRVLRLGTVEAFAGGAKMLAWRTIGLLVRGLALIFVLFGLLAVLGLVLQTVLLAIFGQGTTISVPTAGIRVVMVIIAILFAALTVRLSFVLISPIFDIPATVRHAWTLVQGNTWRIFMAIVVVCFPILFVGTILDSALLRMGPVEQDPGSMEVPGLGALLLLQVLGATINCLQVGAATAIVIEAFERLGAWGRGRIVSEIV